MQASLSPTTARGAAAEQRACHYLENQGLVLLEKNYSTRLGEIDLIMRDGDQIVFVEVRSRKDEEYGDAIESVDAIKQRKIYRAASLYLLEKNWFDKVYCRFDILGVLNQDQHEQIDWVKNAFTLDDIMG